MLFVDVLGVVLGVGDKVVSKDFYFGGEINGFIYRYTGLFDCGVGFEESEIEWWEVIFVGEGYFSICGESLFEKLVV